MAGVPLLNGFLSQGDVLRRDAVRRSTPRLMAVAAAAWAPRWRASSAWPTSLRFIHDVFFNGEPVDLPQHAARAAALDARAGRGAGRRSAWWSALLPALTVGPLLAVAAAAACSGGPLPEYSLALWHGFNPPLLMSVLADGRRRGALLRAAALRQPAPRDRAPRGGPRGRACSSSSVACARHAADRSRCRTAACSATCGCWCRGRGRRRAALLRGRPIGADGACHLPVTADRAARG